MKIVTINNIGDVPNKKYEGYIWFSDQREPVILRNESFDFTQIEENPFVVEALLYCDDEDFSIAIQHTGNYIIKQYNLKEWHNELNKEGGEKEEEKRYLPILRLKSVGMLKFTQFWILEEDALCEGMKVLQLKASVFKGFEK